MTVERAAEKLARAMNRRQFLSRASAVTFGTITAWTIGASAWPTQGAAVTCAGNTSLCGCSPPNGTYCDSHNSSYCNGAACAGGCTFDTTVWSTGCWCTKTCCYLCGSTDSYCGYYKCCDCKCPGSLKCGCRNFVYTCRNGTRAGSPDGLICC